MSELLQFGYHPDADQISAFVEQALPMHERELLLNHLAVCPECRAIVTLSLPEVQVPAQPAAPPDRRPERKSWRLGWLLALPLGGALAAAVLTFVYLYPTPGTRVSNEPRIADAQPAPRPNATAQPAGLPERQGAPESRKTAASGASAVSPAPFPGAVTAGHAIGGPIVTGRNFASLRTQSEQPSISTERSFAPAAKAAPTSGAGVDSAVSAFAREPAKPSEGAPQTFAANQPAPTGNSAAQAPLAPTKNASQTVEVQSAAQSMDTVSADLSNQEVAENELKTNRPLPSHLAILSSATLGKHIVAIDSAHNVFASKDSGKHWKQIPTAWQGHPMQASLILPARGSLQAGLSNFSPAAAQAQLSPAAPGTLSGTVMDRSGAVIAGASVTATEIATGIAHATRTDSAGHYILNGLLPGMYRVEAQSPGFREQQVPGVAIQPTRPAIANLTLDVGEATETVTVEVNGAGLNTTQKKQAKPQASHDIGTVFLIVTDSGDRWTSTDGLSWIHN